MNPRVTLRDVSVRYPNNAEVTLDHLTVDIDQGEILGVMGNSGTGKSTLLGAIIGTVELESGSVVVAGEDVSREPIHKRGVGMVFQDGQLFPHRTVAKNISFGLEMKREPRAARDARVAELLELIGLPERGQSAVSELSGGQRQRVALARSLAPRPSVVLLDEPFAQLDAELRIRLAQDVRSILKREGTTALLVSHDPEDMAQMCDRVMYLRDGKLWERPELSHD